MSDTTEKRLKVSREGVVLIKSFEGFRASAQPRPDGGWVIGYGHTRSAREGLTVSEPDAELLLQYDLLPVVAALNDQAPVWLNQHQFDALASYVFSTGVDGFGGSEVLKRLRDNAPDEAADAMVGWPEIAPADAVVRRRAAERALFVAAADTPVTLAQLMAAPLPPPPYQPPVEAAPEFEAQAAVEAVEPEAADDVAVTEDTVVAAEPEAPVEVIEEATPVVDTAEEAPVEPAEAITTEAVVGDIADEVDQPTDAIVGEEPAEVAPEDEPSAEADVASAEAPTVETPESPLVEPEPEAVVEPIEYADVETVIVETAEAEPAPVAVEETTPAEEAEIEAASIETADTETVTETEAVGDAAEVEARDEEAAPTADNAPMLGDAVSEVIAAIEAETSAPFAETDEPAVILDVAEPVEAASGPSAEPTLAEVAEAEAVAASDTEVAAMVVEPSEPQTPTETTGPALPSAIGLRFSPYANVVVGPLLGIGGGMSAAAPASDETAAPPPVEPLAVEAVAETPVESTVVSEPVVETEAVAADYAAHSPVEDAPGLVLTPPDESDPPIIRPAWAEAERNFTSDDQSPLFEEPLQIAPGAILRHEVIAAPRRTDWSETGAFVAMGGIGLVSFGAAMAAFRRAGEQQSGGDQTAVVGWVLALIALICVGVSGYNLFRHWASERQSD